MKSIGSDCYLDTAGQLYITVPGTIDSFDPPGYQPPPVLKATGHTFEDVPIYGWPLGVIYQNNPLQFASEATAEKMAKRVAAVGGYRARVRLEEVKVGPYTWKPIRKLYIEAPGGESVDLNAGLLASASVRSEKTFDSQLREEVAREWAKRADWL